MKKILLFLLLFVNLQIVTSEGDFFVTAGTEAVAQRFQVQDGDFWWCNEGDDLGWYRSVVPCWDFEVVANFKTTNSSDSGGGSVSYGGGSNDRGSGGFSASGSSHNDVVSDSIQASEELYHKPDSNEVLFKEKLPAKVIKQWYDNDCVLTVIAICQSLLDEKCSEEDEVMRLIEVQEECKALFGVKEIKKMRCGLDDAMMVKLCNRLGMSVSNINCSDITKCIGYGKPVIGALSKEAVSLRSGYSTTMTQSGHEVLIVGYVKDGIDNVYRCIDPNTGLYALFYSFEFENSSFYQVFSKKRNK